MGWTALPERVEVTGVLDHVGVGQIRRQPADIGQPSPGRLGTQVPGPTGALEMLGAHIPVAVADGAALDGEGRDHAVTVEQMVQGAAGVVLPATGPVSEQGAGQILRDLPLDRLDGIVVLSVLCLACAEAAQVGGSHRGEPGFRLRQFGGIQGIQIGAQAREIAQVGPFG